MDRIVISDREIGGGTRCFVIAEAGVNHDGELEKALKLVDAAKQAGADAVKFQIFRADSLVMPSAEKAIYQVEQDNVDETQLEMLQRLQLDDDEFRKLSEYCSQKGILFMASPFDHAGVDFLVDLGVPLFKIGSGELTNHPFLSYVASKERPVILSTGMADQVEVDAAVACVRSAKVHVPLILLHCVSNYPAAAETVNLRVMDTLAKRYDVPVGFSDHTRGIEVAIGAAALGACVLEKHLTLSRKLKGPDHMSSLEPLEFKAMVYAVRNVEKALGDGVKKPVESEASVAQVARRSLFAAVRIDAGMTVSEEHFVVKRPGNGLPPTLLETLVGQECMRVVEAGEMITRDMFDAG